MYVASDWADAVQREEPKKAGAALTPQSCQTFRRDDDFPCCDENMFEGEPEETICIMIQRILFQPCLNPVLQMSVNFTWMPKLGITVCAGIAFLSAAVRSLGVEVVGL